MVTLPRIARTAGLEARGPARPRLNFRPLLSSRAMVATIRGRRLRHVDHDRLLVGRAPSSS